MRANWLCQVLTCTPCIECCGKKTQQVGITMEREVAFKWALIAICKWVVRYRVISMTHYLSVVAVLPKPTEANKAGRKINVSTFLPWQASVAPNKHLSYFSLPKNTKTKLKRHLRDAFTTFLFASGLRARVIVEGWAVVPKVMEKGILKTWLKTQLHFSAVLQFSNGLVTTSNVLDTLGASIGKSSQIAKL